MGKDSTTKTVVIAGGIGLAVYLLANQSFRQKLQDAVAQFSSNIGGGGGGFPSIQMPSIQLPQFSMPQLPAADLTGGLQDLLGGLNAQAGLGGLEVYHSEQSGEDSALYLSLAEQFGLIVTGGSDFHGENKPAISLGTGQNGNLHLSYSLLEQMRSPRAQRAG